MPVSVHNTPTFYHGQLLTVVSHAIKLYSDVEEEPAVATASQTEEEDEEALLALPPDNKIKDFKSS
jgi:hypothetical protein